MLLKQFGTQRALFQGHARRPAHARPLELRLIHLVRLTEQEVVERQVGMAVPEETLKELL